jgi:hypothetical protein
MRVPRKGSESPLNLARGAIECTDLMNNFKDAKMRMLPNNGRRKKLQRQRLKKGLAMRQQRKRLAELPNDLQFNAQTVEGLTGRAHVKKIS